MGLSAFEIRWGKYKKKTSVAIETNPILQWHTTFPFRHRDNVSPGEGQRELRDNYKRTMDATFLIVVHRYGIHLAQKGASHDVDYVGRTWLEQERQIRLSIKWYRRTQK